MKKPTIAAALGGVSKSKGEDMAEDAMETEGDEMGGDMETAKLDAASMAMDAVKSGDAQAFADALSDFYAVCKE